MRLKEVSFAIASMFLLAVACARVPKTNGGHRASDHKMDAWDSIVTDFSARIGDYAELRGELEYGLPPLAITDNPEEILRAVHARAETMRLARAGARQGEIFTWATSAEFRRALRVVMNANNCTAVMDDNPGPLSNRVNGTYPADKPRSTVPSDVLAVLPILPREIEYRFAGHDLILLDMRANTIIDKMPDAIQCPNCDPLTCHR